MEVVRLVLEGCQNISYLFYKFHVSALKSFNMVFDGK